MQNHDYPEAFLSRMKERLGASYETFLDSLNQPADRSIRYNPKKLSEEAIQEVLANGRAVPWCDEAVHVGEDFYPSRDPGYFQGLYYPQEASAMLPAELLEVSPFDRVLDLCAAPGGKSSQIAAKLGSEGLLVSNEISSKRAKILASNLERLGFDNTVVLNAKPDQLEKPFETFFDKILVDAPCSGEGMFRKDPAAREMWHESLPEECALRQKKILESADRMLKPGGKLVYSTCTFSPEENEDIAEWLCQEKGYIPVVHEVEGLGKDYQFHLYPHLIEGEGQYALSLQKPGGERKAKKFSSEKVPKKQLNLYQDFEKKYLKKSFEHLSLQGDRLYALPSQIDSKRLKGLSVISPGVELGVFKKDRFEPSHALAMSLNTKDFTKVYEMNEDEFWAYLRGEALPASAPDGWILMSYLNHPVGFGKSSAGRINNRFPKGLRVFTNGKTQSRD